MTQAWSQWEGQIVNGEFHLEKYLGSSDQGAVFLTECRGQEPQLAAIKLVPADVAEAELQLSRWGLAQRLSHPHLIRLLRKGRCRLRTSDFIFVVMEYAEENLAQIVPQRPLTTQEVREMLRPTLDALAYLHSRGFVHPHLKPADIMAANDQLKLSSENLIEAGETLADAGKLTMYDAPEKTSGANSPAASVWSLGMILAEALTQRLPTWIRETTADPVLPANLPGAFLDIVRGCLRREPGDRWTVAGITARLHPTSPGLQPEPKSADQPQTEGQPIADSRTESAIRRFAFPALVALLAVVALFVSLGQLRQKTKIPQQVSAAKPEHEPERQSAKASDQPTVAGQPAHAPDKLMAGMRARPASLRSEPQAAQINRSPEASRVVHQVLPDVPQSASDTIQGTIIVRVRVNVDSSGRVQGAELELPGPSKYFGRLALAAAQNWKFATIEPDLVREFIVHFEFTNSETRAFATRASP